MSQTNSFQSTFVKTLQLVIEAEEKFPGIIKELEEIQIDRHKNEMKKIETFHEQKMKEAKWTGFRNGILTAFGFKPKEYRRVYFDRTLTAEQSLEKDALNIRKDLEVALQKRDSSIQKLTEIDIG